MTPERWQQVSEALRLCTFPQPSDWNISRRSHSAIRAAKRGGDQVTIFLDEHLVRAKSRPLEVVALDDALNELSRMNPQHSRIVELRFFAGLSIEETALVVGVSPATVKRDWAVARAWLYRELARNVHV